MQRANHKGQQKRKVWSNAEMRLDKRCILKIFGLICMYLGSKINVTKMDTWYNEIVLQSIITFPFEIFFTQSHTNEYNFNVCHLFYSVIIIIVIIIIIINSIIMVFVITLLYCITVFVLFCNFCYFIRIDYYIQEKIRDKRNKTFYIINANVTKI